MKKYRVSGHLHLDRKIVDNQEGFELCNQHRQWVSFESLLYTDKWRYGFSRRVKPLL